MASNFENLTNQECIEMFFDSDSDDGSFEGFESDDCLGSEDGNDREEIADDFQGFEGVPILQDADWQSVDAADVGLIDRNEPAYPAGWLKAFDNVAGPSIDFTPASEFDIFQSVFPPDIISMIVEETNRYADTFFNERLDRGEAVPAYLQEWKEVTTPEMYGFLAIIFIMGIVQKPAYKTYWTSKYYLHSEGFCSIMARNRFLIILKFLHVCDNSKRVGVGQPGYDRCFKIKELQNRLLSSWQDMYNLGQDLSIDEGMIAFKGKVIFKQYMPNKPIKRGMKAWILSDARSGYTYKWDLYSGKDEGRDLALPMIDSVVLKLVQGLENKGHIVYTDNFYSNPTLFVQLSELGIGACGTVKINRVGLPSAIKPDTNGPRKGKPKVSSRNKGPLFFRNKKLLACAWFDSKPVYTLSTISNNNQIVKRRRTKRVAANTTGFKKITKPVIIDTYNTFMAGVDRGDQFFSYYGFQRRSLKWWKKIAFHFMEIAMVNAWIMYHHVNPKGKESIDFRIAVIDGLLENNIRKPVSRIGGRPASNPPSRLIARHFPRKIPGTRRPNCRVCSNLANKQRKQTSAQCEDCKAPLCVFPCFEIYHTVLDYQEFYNRNHR